MIIFTIVAGLLVFDSLDKFLSISGALMCTPIAFILPAMFHFKAGAETPCQKNIDLAIIIGGVIIMVFCTGYGIYAWNA